MDDLTAGADDAPQTIEQSCSLRQILDEIHLPLVKWMGSSPGISVELRKKGFSMRYEQYTELPVTKILGIQWDPNTDKILYKPIPELKKYTKRSICSLVASIFDSLGLISPALLEMKLLLQTLWAEKSDWDKEINDDQKTQVLTWMEGLKEVLGISFSRWTGALASNGFSIHNSAQTDEKKTIGNVAAAVACEDSPFEEIANRFSGYSRMLRVLTRIRRLATKAEMSRQISPHELKMTERMLIKQSQAVWFAKEIHSLRKDLRRLEKERRKCIGKFWELWKKSYLMQLRNFHESRGQSTESQIGVGRVVLVEKTSCSPFFWPLAHVTKIFPGRDGVVRR
uniref:DUF5641 domain-containing protein n=1 Tax=Strigamia maritima TaxID=126957 RepID=T1IH56_STRMM